MSDKCKTCQIRAGCDIFSEMCRLSPREVVRLRPDTIRKLNAQQRYYYANREAINAKYRESNNAAGRKYRAENRDRRLETERNWRAKYKDQINAKRRAKRQEQRI